MRMEVEADLADLHVPAVVLGSLVHCQQGSKDPLIRDQAL